MMLISYFIDAAAATMPLRRHFDIAAAAAASMFIR